MFEITYVSRTNFQWSCDFIFNTYEEAKTYLTNKGFTKATNGFESNLDSTPKAYVTPKKIYKA